MHEASYAASMRCEEFKIMAESAGSASYSGLLKWLGWWDVTGAKWCGVVATGLVTRR